MDFGSTENRGIFLQVLKGPVTRYFDPLTWTAKTKDCAIYYSCATTITEQGVTSTPLVRPNAKNRTRLEAGQAIKRDNYKSGDTQGLGTGHGFACGRSRAIPDLYVIGYQNGKCVFVYLEC